MEEKKEKKKKRERYEERLTRAWKGVAILRKYDEYEAERIASLLRTASFYLSIYQRRKAKKLIENAEERLFQLSPDFFELREFFGY